MEILQAALPFAPWTDPRHRRLPGIQPLPAADWLFLDDAYGAQMALRDRLIAERPEAVHALDPGARPAAVELLERVLADLPRLPGFGVTRDVVTRPDGCRVGLDRAAPLHTLGRLLQADFCLLESRGGPEHLLTSAILCFPASWRLDEKFMRPLSAVHAPVVEYDDRLAVRVQRLFDAIRPEQPLWRVNVLGYADPTLHQPRSAQAPRPRPQGPPEFVRSERQVLLRLPRSRAVVFAIHTAVVRRAALTQGQAAALAAMEQAAELR